MGDPSLDWEIVDYYPCLDEEDELNSGKSKLMGCIINGGLSLGKKLVITGVVMSSVPFMLPPLVVISALGLAISVPFGVIFASYACTEKLMSKLLPSPPLLEYETDREKEQRHESIQLELVDGEGIDVSADPHPEFVNINVEEAHPSEIEPSVIEGVDSTAKSKEDQNNVYSTSEKDSEFTAQPHPDKVADGEEVKDKFVQPGKSETVTVDTGVEGTFKEKEGSNILSKGKGRKKNQGKKKDKGAKGENKASAANLSGEMALVQETSTDDLASVSGEKKKQEKPQQSTPTVSDRSGDDYNQSRIRDSEKSASTKLKHDEGTPGMMEPKNAAPGHSLVVDNEEHSPEDKIWKQLDAIRAIVGLKAARHPSYLEELKALYVFTGIEPPSSKGDPSDSKEFHDRLVVLMSVIGLKSQP